MNRATRDSEQTERYRAYYDQHFSRALKAGQNGDYETSMRELKCLMEMPKDLLELFDPKRKLLFMNGGSSIHCGKFDDGAAYLSAFVKAAENEEDDREVIRLVGVAYCMLGDLYYNQKVIVNNYYDQLGMAAKYYMRALWHKTDPHEKSGLYHRLCDIYKLQIYIIKRHEEEFLKKGGDPEELHCHDDVLMTLHNNAINSKKHELEDHYGTSDFRKYPVSDKLDLFIVLSDCCKEFAPDTRDKGRSIKIYKDKDEILGDTGEIYKLAMDILNDILQNDYVRYLKALPNGKQSTQADYIQKLFAENEDVLGNYSERIEVFQFFREKEHRLYYIDKGPDHYVNYGRLMDFWSSVIQEDDDYDIDEVVEMHNSAGWALFQNGCYARARTHFEYVLRRLPKPLNHDDLDQDEAFKGFFRCCGRLGEFDKAIECARVKYNFVSNESKNPEIKVTLPETLSYLGMLYLENGDTSEANDLLKLCKEHLERAICWPELGFYYCSLDDTEEAFSWSKKTLNIPYVEVIKIASETKYQLPHNINMGNALYRSGKYKDAKFYYEQAYNIGGGAVGYDHFDMGTVYIHLLSVVITAFPQLMDHAAEYIRNAIAFVKKQTALAREIYDNNTRYNYLQTSRHILSLIHTLIYLDGSLIPESDICELLVFTDRACVNAEYIQMSKLRSIVPDFSETYHSYLALKEREQALYPHWSLDLLSNELGDTIFQHEWKLADYLRYAETIADGDGMNIDTIMRRLHPGCAVLEFGSYQFTNGPYSEPGFLRNVIGIPETDFPVSKRYYVSIITDQASSVVYYKNSDRIENLTEGLLESIKAGDDDAGAALKLYRALITPIREKLIDIETILVVPCGILAKLPFQYVFDITEGSGNRDIEYLASLRSLLPQGRVVKNIEAVSIYADPVFSDDFGRLPWTELEGKSISKEIIDETAIVPGVYMKLLATRKKLLSETANIIHLATHGFALSKGKSDEEWLALGAIAKLLPYPNHNNPLTRCGLLLSPSDDSGIVSGNDMLTMDLSDTYLVSLSACETGLGMTQTNEGIIGLRRVFELTDAENLLCTLWEVDDCASYLLMRQFYHLIVTEGFGLNEALSQAQNYVRCLTKQKVRKFMDQLFREGYPELAQSLAYAGDISIDGVHPFVHPFYWAGFILIHCKVRE